MAALRKKDDRGPRLKRKHRTRLRLAGAGLLLSWCCLMGWPTRPGPFAYGWPFFAALGLCAAAAALPWLSLRRANPEALVALLRGRRGALLVLAGCAAGLLAAEWATRLSGRAEWGGGQGPLQPSFRLARYRINSLGLRGGEFPEPGAGAEDRVLVLGDSFAFGQGVGEHETFPRIIEETLNAQRPDRTVRVLNASKPGWNTVDEHLFLEKLGRAYGARTTIVAFTLNDAESEPYFLTPLTGTLWETRWLWRSHIFFLGVKAYNAAAQPYEAHIRALYADDRPGWRDCRQALDLIARRCRQDSSRPVLAIFPILQNLERYPFGPAHAAVAAAARQAGFEVLDLLDDFRASGLPAERLRGSAGDWHPNAEGHRLAARALLRLLKRKS